MKYICFRCGRRIASKLFMKNHLKRIDPCPVVYLDISREYMLENYTKCYYDNIFKFNKLTDYKFFDEDESQNFEKTLHIEEIIINKIQTAINNINNEPLDKNLEIRYEKAKRRIYLDMNSENITNIPEDLFQLAIINEIVIDIFAEISARNIKIITEPDTVEKNNMNDRDIFGVPTSVTYLFRNDILMQRDKLCDIPVWFYVKQ